MNKGAVLILSVVVLFIFAMVGCKSDTGAEERAAFEKQVETRLNEADTNIQKLNEKVENAAGETKEALNEMVDNLEIQKETARAKLQELKVAGGDAWRDIKAEVDKAVEELESSYNDIVARFP